MQTTNVGDLEHELQMANLRILKEIKHATGILLDVMGTSSQAFWVAELQRLMTLSKNTLEIIQNLPYSAVR